MTKPGAKRRVGIVTAGVAECLGARQTQRLRASAVRGVSFGGQVRLLGANTGQITHWTDATLSPRATTCVTQTRLDRSG